MKNLEMQVQKMVEGEKKRRDIAIDFIQKVENILIPIAVDIWGTGSCDDTGNTVNVLKKDINNNNRPSGIYLRYDTWNGTNDAEYEGFYYSDHETNVWGKPITDLRGKQFWYAVQCILNWVKNFLPEILERRENSRNELLNLIK